MSAWAKPGVKCVCISGPHDAIATGTLVVGRIYEIAERLDHPEHGVLVRLAAVTGPNGETGKYKVSRFRPLITKTIEQDVQMILSLLTPDEVSA